MKKTLMFSCVLMFVLFTVSAYAVPTTLYFHEYSATADPIVIGTSSTGEISISMDLSNPAAQTFTYDLDSNTWGSNIDLILSFENPDFSTVALPASDEGPINGSLSSTFFYYNGSQYGVSEVSGSGTVFDGSTGSYINTVELYDADFTLPNGPLYKSDFTGPLWISYGGEVIAESFIEGSGTLGSSPVPEPTTMLLFGAGLVGLVGFGRKKFKKQSN